MGLVDKLKQQLGQHGDKVEKGLDRAAETADKKTQGKYRDKIRKGSEQAKQASRRYGEQQGDRRRQSGQPGASRRGEGPG